MTLNEQYRDECVHTQPLPTMYTERGYIQWLERKLDKAQNVLQDIYDESPMDAASWGYIVREAPRALDGLRDVIMVLKNQMEADPMFPKSSSMVSEPRG